MGIIIGHLIILVGKSGAIGGVSFFAPFLSFGRPCWLCNGVYGGGMQTRRWYANMAVYVVAGDVFQGRVPCGRNP